MGNDQAVMGTAIALVCTVGLVKSAWLFERTKKGQRLAQWFGERAGLWLLRGLMCSGIVFGVLAAVDIIRPIRW